MGYNTEFDGVINFSRELTVSELRIIENILDDSDADKIALATGYASKPDDEYSYLSLEVNDDYNGISWNGNEKTYYMVTSLNVVFHAIRQQIPDLSFHGFMHAEGEGSGDIWGIEVKDGIARRIEVDKPHMTRCPKCMEWFLTVRAETNADCKVARLRDAAPDLLTALKALTKKIDWAFDSEIQTVMDEELTAAEAAIAKAEGCG